MPKSKDIQTEGRLTKLETLVTEIKDNHLVHIEEKLDRIGWLIVLSLGGLAVDLALKLL